VERFSKKWSAVQYSRRRQEIGGRSFEGAIPHLQIGQRPYAARSFEGAVFRSSRRRGTNAVAFGSMAVSSYPGMPSMGKLMALALFCTLAAAVLFQPILMGRPRLLEAGSPRPHSLPAPAK
jgi:hypothetical protein